MAVTLRELTDVNREAVLALRVASQQERFVGGSVQNALATRPSIRRPSRGTGPSMRVTSLSGSS
jgi:hypothetical protein